MRQPRTVQRIGAVVAAMVLAGPLLHLALLSLAPGWVWPRLVPEQLSSAGWEALLFGGDAPFAVLLRSVAIAVAVAASSTGIGFLAARAISISRWRRTLETTVYLPFVLSPVVLAPCLHYLAIRLGVAGSLAGVVLAQTIFAVALATILLLSFWTREQREMEDAARMLGAGTAEVYRRITLPSARRALWLALVQTFLLSWFQYGLTVTVGGGTVTTLPTLVFAYIGEANVPLAAAAGLLLALPPIVLLLVNRRALARPI